MTVGAAAGRVAVLGIRHHGPGSARSVLAELDRVRPAMVLIEGPADADPLVALAASPEMVPPVALLAYAPEAPQTSAFWPFAEFSPEWQALRWAAEHTVPVRFCDLPAAAVLAHRDEPEERPARSAVRADPIARMADAAGYDDPERWWDDVVESRGSGSRAPVRLGAVGRTSPAAVSPAGGPGSAAGGPGSAAEGPGSAAEGPGGGTEGPGGGSGGQDGEARGPGSAAGGPGSAAGDPDPDPDPDAASPFPALVEAMAELRVGHPEREWEQRREAYMRRTLRAALKDVDGPVAVVCGAWHGPALTEPLPPAAADARVLRGLRKRRTALTWVPWTHARLTTASGYGAGIASPGWYQHLFTSPDEPVARWLTAVAGVLRERDLPVSSAHVIEAVRLAEALAVLRGRPLAGLAEVTDATRAVLCGGDDVPLRYVTDALVLGERLGEVPADTPSVPLEVDLTARARTLRLKRDPVAKRHALDLRREIDRGRSVLLHQLRALGVRWGTRVDDDVASTGTFRESWELRWRPELAVAVIDAAGWGTTVAAAATARLADAARGATSLAVVTSVVEQVLLADLPEALEPVLAALSAKAALDLDVEEVMAAVPPLVRARRYGDVRGTDTGALDEVVDALLVRVVAGLPAAVTGLGDEAATRLREGVDALHAALALRGEPTGQRAWLELLGRIADRRDVHGLLAGRIVRLLLDADVVGIDEAARRLSAQLSGGIPVAAQAAWAEGLLGGGTAQAGLLLVHDRALLGVLDRWVAGLDDAAFTSVLPLVRRTFGTFTRADRAELARAVRQLDQVVAAPVDEELDARRAAAAVRMVELIQAGAP